MYGILHSSLEKSRLTADCGVRVLNWSLCWGTLTCVCNHSFSSKCLKMLNEKLSPKGQMVEVYATHEAGSRGSEERGRQQTHRRMCAPQNVNNRYVTRQRRVAYKLCRSCFAFNMCLWAATAIVTLSVICVLSTFVLPLIQFMQLKTIFLI